MTRIARVQSLRDVQPSARTRLDKRLPRLPPRLELRCQFLSRPVPASTRCRPSRWTSSAALRGSSPGSCEMRRSRWRVCEDSGSPTSVEGSRSCSSALPGSAVHLFSGSVFSMWVLLYCQSNWTACKNVQSVSARAKLVAGLRRPSGSPGTRRPTARTGSWRSTRRSC